jgi:hypothetical protein
MGQAWQAFVTSSETCPQVHHHTWALTFSHLNVLCPGQASEELGESAFIHPRLHVLEAQPPILLCPG